MKKYSSKKAVNQEESLVLSFEEIILAGAAENVRIALEQERGNYLKAMERLRVSDGSPAIVGNGYGKERLVMSTVGYVPVSVPRTRNRSKYLRFDGSLENFSSEILPPYARKTLKLEETIPLLYLHGLSTNDFVPALEKIYGKQAVGISAPTISRMLLEWEKELEAWKNRDFSEKEYCYVWVDGIYFTVRNSNDYLCILVLIGATKEGKKELIMTEAGYRESTESWLSLIRRLKSQGLKAPKLFIGDGALGFWASVKQVYPGVREQRCWVHKTVNVLDKLPKSRHKQAKSMIHGIYMADSKKESLKNWDIFCDTYRDKYPKVVECLEKDKEKLLTFYDYPAAHWIHLRTTNPIESTFATARLRTAKTRGNWSSGKTELMVYKMLEKASSRWLKLRKAIEVKKVMDGMIYEDGEEKAA